MKSEILDVFRATEGYNSSAPLLAREPNYLISGSQNLLVTAEGVLQPFKGMNSLGTGGRVMFNFSNTYASLNDNAGTALGSVFAGYGLSLFFIGGNASIYVTGSSVTGTPSSTLKFRLLRSGSYTAANTGPYDAGLSAPSAPTVGVRTATSTKTNGTYSFKIAKVRSTTGAVSNASPVSVVVNAVKNTIRIGFPALGTSSGADRWRIYSTPVGFGETGPHFELMEIAASLVERTETTNITTNGTTTLSGASGVFLATDVGKQITLSVGGSLVTTISSVAGGGASCVVAAAPGWSSSGNTGVIESLVDSVARGYEIDFTDADLLAANRLAPTDHGVPPAGIFGCMLEGAIAVIGCYGDSTSGPSTGTPGNAVAVSLPNQPEHFPATNLLFLPEPPVFVLPRAADGYVYIVGKNSISVLSYVGGDMPMALEVIWSNVGFPAPHAFCVTEGGQIYGYSGKRGLVRTGAGGMPETRWASRVHQDTKSWTAANVVVGYDADRQFVMYAHSSTILFFDVNNEKWSAPITLATLTAPVSGSIVSCVTDGGALKVSVNNAGTFTLYGLDSGSGSSWVARWPHRDGNTPQQDKTITGIQVALQGAAAANVAVQLIKNMGPVYSVTRNVAASGATEHFRTMKVRVKNAKSYAPELSGTSAGEQITEVVVSGFVMGRRI